VGCLRELNWKISYGPEDDRLRQFYIPALSRSVLYERSAGFFSSWALAMAAAGVAHLVRANGRMRLLVGAELSEEDVEAIETGEEAFGSVLEERLLEALEQLVADPTDLARRRLEVLAWMVAAGRLDIRVVLPLGPDGRPLPAPLAREYFHAKEGVFTDSCGHQVAFTGSVNETPHGWQSNYEQFSVYFSWDHTRPYLLQVVERIRRLWNGREKGWRAIPISEAVRQKLIRLAPKNPPEVDPLEQEIVRPPESIPMDQRERIIFAFLRDAPHLKGGEVLGIRTAGIQPWPHQERVANEIVRRFPERFLLADEVGLGKTIEAGLALRTLVLSGAVRRCLIIVPKGVLRQWQEELYEKFSLNIPAYDGQGFFDYFGRLHASADNPWEAFPLILTSSQLVKRRERTRQLLEASPWDLVIVDEAHHARRKEFLTNRYRPNRLLALLEGEHGLSGLARRTKGLLLLSATPMQVHPVELYDLMRLLDLPAEWATEGRFIRFLEELHRARQGDGGWQLLLRLARASSKNMFPEDLVGSAAGKLGPIGWERVRELFLGDLPVEEVRKLTTKERAVLLELCRRASPIGRRMFRTTRETLRRYQEAGILKENVPERNPEPTFIRMTEQEWALYGRVEDYVSDYYQRFEAKRQGLGFVVTVYRRRLTSSFAALRRSLERRRDFLLKQSGPLFGLEDEDLEDADLSQDKAEELEEALSEAHSRPDFELLLKQELSYIDTLLDQLSRLPEDNKFKRLADDLSALLAERNTVAVFTHYTDTMDYLRDRLIGLYGRSLACYSGRGGERWNGSQWIRVSKEEVKNAFRSGEIRVLLCTDAASEGLNLQTCGVLINYDMPWNPMRVEQRIGRFDRIGQQYPDVWIRHYFLLGPRGEETVEAKVYSSLQDRIDWFRAVVGELSPVLGRIERVIEQAAVNKRDVREAYLKEALAEIRKEIETHAALPSLDEWAEPVVSETSPAPPVDLRDLERLLMESSLGRKFRPDPDLPGVYVLEFSGKDWRVTFDPVIADAHPGRVHLLTYGEPLLEELLRAVPDPVCTSEGKGVIRVAAGEIRRWFRMSDDRLREISNIADLNKALSRSLYLLRENVEEAKRKVKELARDLSERRYAVERERVEVLRESLLAKARALVAEAAACFLLMSRDIEPRGALKALVDRGYPWSGLVTVANYPSYDDIKFAQTEVDKRDLEQHFFYLEAEARKLLGIVADCRTEVSPDSDINVGVTTNLYCMP